MASKLATRRRILQVAATRLLALGLGGGIVSAGYPGHPGSLLAEENGSSANTLRILSFNIHHGEGTDGHFDLDRIAALIRDARCDLVALQEVDRKTRRSNGADQLSELAAKTDLKASFAKAMDYDGGEYGVAVLARDPFTVQAAHSLPSNPQREPRVACEILVEHRSHPRLVFVSTHLDHSPEPSDRVQQVKELVRLFGHGPSQAILAGDFNAVPDDPVLEPLRRVWFDTDAEHRVPTSPATRPVRKIDYVWIQHDSPWVVSRLQVLDDSVASDHRALFVELQLRNPSAPQGE